MKMSIKKGDLVQVMAGKDKGKQGKVLQVMPKSGKILVEKINMTPHHVKSNQQGQDGGIIDKENPLYACKVMRVCPSCKKPTRVGHKVTVAEDGTKKKVSICKKCGAEI